ncbi:MAG: hypothetical protein LBL44_04920, partial [Treponema sp.]|nr:hypothetical protein [Treponema sp.]
MKFALDIIGKYVIISIMKLFEIGTGLISIKVPNNYFSDWENKNTVILYDPENDYINIRISIITVKPNDKSDVNYMHKEVIKDGNNKKCEVFINDDKSFFVYDEQQEENGKDIKIYFYQVGYKCHCIIISVSVLLENINNKMVKIVLNDIFNSIPTISEI